MHSCIKSKDFTPFLNYSEFQSLRISIYFQMPTNKVLPSYLCDSHSWNFHFSRVKGRTFLYLTHLLIKHQLTFEFFEMYFKRVIVYFWKTFTILTFVKKQWYNFLRYNLANDNKSVRTENFIIHLNKILLIWIYILTIIIIRISFAETVTRDN